MNKKQDKIICIVALCVILSFGLPIVIGNMINDYDNRLEKLERKVYR